MLLTALVRTLGKTSGVGLMNAFRSLRASVNLLPVRRLTRQQEGLNVLSFAANDEAGKPPEPFPFGHLRLGIQPAGQENDLVP